MRVDPLAQMCQRLLFATAYKQDRLRPLVQEGYAWLTNWLSTDILQDPDGRLNMDAIRGAEGLIALREKAVHPTVTSSTSICESQHKPGAHNPHGAASKRACALHDR